MTTLLSILGPNGILWALGAAVIAAFGIFMKGRLSGAQLERAKQAKRDAKALGERLEMDREATAAERKVAEMTDDEARRKALEFARKR